MVAGGTLLARAVSLLRTDRRRAATRALLGVGLIAVGLRQRRSSAGREGDPGGLSNESTAETSTDSGEPTDAGSDEADGERDRSSFATEALDDETTVDAVTDPDGGDDADDST